MSANAFRWWIVAILCVLGPHACVALDRKPPPPVVCR